MGDAIVPKGRSTQRELCNKLARLRAWQPSRVRVPSIPTTRIRTYYKGGFMTNQTAEIVVAEVDGETITYHCGACNALLPDIHTYDPARYCPQCGVLLDAQD